VTRLRQRTLEELESRKSLRWCLAGLRIREFDPIAEATEVADHLPSAKLLRSFGNRWGPVLHNGLGGAGTPNQPTQSMGNDPDGLIVSESRDRATIYNFEDASSSVISVRFRQSPRSLHIWSWKRPESRPRWFGTWVDVPRMTRDSRLISSLYPRPESRGRSVFPA